MRFMYAAVLMLFAGGAAAQVAMPCDWQARADAIVEKGATPILFQTAFSI